MITITTQYGIDFYNADGQIVKEHIAADEESRDAFWEALATNEHHPEWPEEAVRIKDWNRKVQRQPIQGIDYGPGSIKRRFGNGRVPRGAYQFR